MKRIWFLVLVALVVAVSCQISGKSLSDEEKAGTADAKTAEAASPTPRPTKTPVDTDTPNPTSTFTVTIIPTDTPTRTLRPTNTRPPTSTPTDTLVPSPTNTPVPTDTPTATPTPVPISFKDDFSTDSSAFWGKCKMCEWTDGRLLIGPYAAGTGSSEENPVHSEFHRLICDACGEATYYNFSVEATFVDGQVDRFFGVLMAENEEYLIYFGVSPWQYYVIEQYNFDTQSWESVQFTHSSIVAASYGTNRIEISVLPAASAGFVDIAIKLNGKTIYFVYSRPALPSKVGLVNGWNTVQASFDNFTYEAIEVK